MRPYYLRNPGAYRRTGLKQTASCSPEATDATARPRSWNWLPLAYIIGAASVAQLIYVAASCWNG